MMMFDRTLTGENNWRNQLNQFVKANQQELAALSWGLFLERERKDTLGIDLEPTPHFVYPETLYRDTKRSRTSFRRFWE